MCGISGALNLNLKKIGDLNNKLAVMNKLLIHRGPDGEGIWKHARQHVGFAHRRLSIIDLETGAQPMTDEKGNWITYNGEIYNYIELRQELKKYSFRTSSDTEVILCAYLEWGPDCVNHFRGMFSFAIWDESKQELFCARDRFGIKPFYYTVVGDVFYFASEVKALLPFVEQIETDIEGFQDYITFQFCLTGKTLFKGVKEIMPGNVLSVKDSAIQTRKYWNVYYNIDLNRSSGYFEDKIRSLIQESVDLHMRSDVKIGAYVSGGLDSCIIASLATKNSRDDFLGFTGKFSLSKDYDESPYARQMAQWSGFGLYEIDIKAGDFIENIRKVIYHLDYPVAGPGSFPQFMVSKLASKHRKVLLGGQGADEIFGGYVRYLLAYFEQCIKGAIDGTGKSGKFIVSYESIIPNLSILKNYKPLIQDFWKSGLFEDLDKRYFNLVNRGSLFDRFVNGKKLSSYSPFDRFREIFNADNVKGESYFDSMTHFDFVTLLPALLHVEDRVSMAHGLESRVPYLDHSLVELAATIPANIKFTNGTLKRILKESMKSSLPAAIFDRKDKMGFPVPFTEWVNGPARDFVCDIFSTRKAQSRELIDNSLVLGMINDEPKFGRKLWGLLSLELWQQEFHDQHNKYRDLLK
jgi:asparagine synthase (glutamine-hydrolysing)